MIQYKHDTLRLLCHFQHWLGTNYNNLPTDSVSMTERSRRFIKENVQELCCCDNPNAFKEMEEGVELCSKCKKPY